MPCCPDPQRGTRSFRSRPGEHWFLSGDSVSVDGFVLGLPSDRSRRSGGTAPMSGASWAAGAQRCFARRARLRGEPPVLECALNSRR